MGIAVVGCGRWGKNLVRNFHELGALGMVCDASATRLDELRARLPGVALTADFAEVVNSREVAGVVVATPAGTHYDFARKALLADKDVFVEKPLALSASQGRDLVALAAQRGRILMVGHILRYHPAIRKLKTLIEEGSLGKICYIYSNRLNLGTFRTEENILWSFAPHDISAMLYLLGEDPISISAHGGTYISPGVADVTVTALGFRAGVRGHIFVSWLHPYKEQKLVVVGDRRMAVFDDLAADHKLVLLSHSVEWVNRVPVPRPEAAEPVGFSPEEPLRAECRHFLDCIDGRTKPETDGAEGVRVLEILDACQRALDRKGAEPSSPRRVPEPFYAHETAAIDEGCDIGNGTSIWHFSHVMKNARIGRNCTIGQNAFIASDVVVGNNVKIQNNVSLYTGVVLEDDVFCGPSVVFTNVINPRSRVSRKDEYRPTLVRQGASLGANATVVCGQTIGRYAFIGAGAVVTRAVPDYALVVGNPGRVVGWMCRCGIKLAFVSDGARGEERAQCRSCGAQYTKRGHDVSATAPEPAERDV